jgi:4-hydroxybenzoate polyprenyltransferase
MANHVGLFDEVIASDGQTNLCSDMKRKVLVQRFGERGFDYVGNQKTARPVWESARKAIVIGTQRQIERIRPRTEVERVFAIPSPSVKSWVKAIRLHQWAKNVLIFLPAILAHQILKPHVLLASALAFVAFGLCASSVYIINDLLDLAADRSHPRKCKRPFASGQLSVGKGLAGAALLITSAAVLALVVGPAFTGVLAGYYILTWSYSLRLKRAAIVDVMTLAGLYTIRIIAGAAATAIAPSFWLLAFSMFIFLSLSFVKRYAELDEARKSNEASTRRRGYDAGDLPLLLNLGTTSGLATIVVMALYIDSASSQVLYRHHKPLWLICPLLLYWISRVWLLTTRGQMPDDPVVFALRDRISLIVAGLLGLIVLISI